MLFLLGMFIIGQALIASDYLYYAAYRFFGGRKSVQDRVMGVLFGTAVGSALLMNDTLAIISTPLVLRLSMEHNINSKLLLYTVLH
jgi:Na+/H+ antiporter NhaD/arsenite permease-like protein